MDVLVVPCDGIGPAEVWIGLNERNRLARCIVEGPHRSRKGIPVAQVEFTVVRSIPLPAREVFAELTDWAGHAEWVPMTRVEILTGDGGPGTEFVATTGMGPAALPDRMRVDALDPEAMTVVITKIGPVLSGKVRLRVVSTGETSSRLEWFEGIEVPYAPQFLARPIAFAASRGFESAISRMVKRIRSRQQS